MKKLRSIRELQIGFTLVEMAVVLVIIAVLLSGLVLPLTAQQDMKHAGANRSSLKTIQEALLGFVILNGRLPCPATESDPANANYGLEDSSCNASYSAEGYLPWRTLGVDATDAWGTNRINATDDWKGYWRYRVDRNFTSKSNFDIQISSATATYGDTLQIQDSDGNLLSSTIERPVAIIFSTGKDLSPNGENSDYEQTSGLYESNPYSPAFDDTLIWITRPIIVSRLVSASRLP